MKNKPLKIIAFVLIGYVCLVVLFESLLGYFQPENASTLEISTRDSSGELSPRIVARLESDGQLYVAANHWPRAWFRDALANPNVEIESASEQGSYIAVPVEGVEHERVDDDNALGLMFRFLTGFPPRYFLRLEPAN